MKLVGTVDSTQRIEGPNGEVFVVVRCKSGNESFSFCIPPRNAETYYVGRGVEIEVKPR